MSELTADPQLELLLRQVAAVSIAPASASAAAEPPLPAGTTLGPYLLLEVVGAGGMGVVYRAHDSRLAREVALKLLPRATGVDEGARQRLLHEARAAAALSHPNLASVYEAGSLDGHAFFAMELVRGASLRALCAGRSGSLAERLGWALDVARGLAAMHRRGWLHRDVKPDNVMVTEDGTAKLLDLGLARAASAVPGPEPFAAGTPGYMSPEQQRAEPLDARADVFSFGVLLQELLTGQVSLSVLPSVSPRPVRALLERCLAADRAQRFASAVEVVAALEPLRQAAGTRGGAPWRWAVALAALAGVGFVAVLVTRPSAQPTTAAPRRLTGHGAERLITDAALSTDGRRFAFIDEEGLTVGETAAPERATVIPLDGLAGAVEPHFAGAGFTVLTLGEADQKSLWRVDDAKPRVLYRGVFKYASLSPDAERVVAVEGARVVVRTAATGAELSALEPVGRRHLHAARWAPFGELFALAYSETDTPDSRVLEVWAVGGTAPVKAIRSRRLAQAYVPVVFSWSEAGLLYALADTPGEGSGSAVWLLPWVDKGVSFAEPLLLARVERQFLAGVELSANGQLLTLREDTRMTANVADISPVGTLSAPRRLTQSDFDERPTGWDSSGSVVLMSLRDLVPHLARRELSGTKAQWVDGQGWAQTWPTPTGAPGELLYWWTPTAPGESPSIWQLSLRSAGAETAVQTPAPAVGEVLTLSAPPLTQRVRCSGARGCVLGQLDGEGLQLFDLALDGGAPVLRFRADAAPSNHGWALSADGEQVALAQDGAGISVRDRSGREVHAVTVPGLEEVRAVAFGAAPGSFYVCGIQQDGQQLVGTLSADGGLEVLQRSTSAYAELHLSPDGRHLAYLEKGFDRDVWMTPVQWR